MKTAAELRERAAVNIGRLIEQTQADLLSLPLRGRLGGGGEWQAVIEDILTPPAPTQPPPEGEGQETASACRDDDLPGALAECQQILGTIANQLNQPLKDRP